MSALFWIAQIALIVGWYVWPAMVAVPWWLVFLPLLFSGVCLAFILLAATAGIVAFANS